MRICNLDFVEEAGGQVRAAGDIGAQNLDRGASHDAIVNRLEHHSHATPSEYPDQAVVSDVLTDPRLGFWRVGLHDGTAKALCSEATVARRDGAPCLMLQADRLGEGVFAQRAERSSLHHISDVS